MSSLNVRSFFGGDDEGDDESSLNAFTFSLLGQLKDSLVTYDNSLKGFLDIGKTANTVRVVCAKPPEENYG